MQLIYLSFANCNTLVQRNAQSHTSARIMTNEDHNILIKCSKTYFNVSCNFVLKAIKILHFSSIKKKKKRKKKKKKNNLEREGFYSHHISYMFLCFVAINQTDQRYKLPFIFSNQTKNGTKPRKREGQ